MITGKLLDDVLMGVKDKLTVMSSIGLEAVNTSFQPPAVPNINAKPPKIIMRIKDVSSGNAYANQRFVQLILRDKRKKGHWEKQVKLNELKPTFAKIFIRMKDFHSLRICVADDGAVSVYDYPYQASRIQEAKEKMAVKRTAFETMLTNLSGAFIGAASSFPQSTITVRRLFFPPHSAGMTTMTVGDLKLKNRPPPIFCFQDAAINLIAFLGPSLTKLRLSMAFPYSNFLSIMRGDCQRLLELIAAKCAGLQKLMICGDLFEEYMRGMPGCLRSLTSLRCFEHSSVDTRLLPYQSPAQCAHWFRRSFELNRSLKRLTVSYKMLAGLVEPSAVPILAQLTTLNVTFDLNFWPEDEKMICMWIACEAQDNGQGSVLHQVLTGMSDGGLLSMQLRCSTYGILARVESLVKTILALAAVTKKVISATFTFPSNDKLLAIVERLKNALPLVDVKQTGPHCFTIQDGTAICMFSSE